LRILRGDERTERGQGMSNRQTDVNKYEFKFKRRLLFVLEPPWRHSGPDNERREHWLTWVAGWVWAIAGLALGAFVGPSLLALAGLANSSYRDLLAVGVAVLLGFWVQFIGWITLAGAGERAARLPEGRQGQLMRRGLLVLTFVAPLVLVQELLFAYYSTVGSGQRSITIAFVGGLLVKTFLIPFIKAL
jgi:hypothetical protein